MIYLFIRLLTVIDDGILVIYVMAHGCAGIRSSEDVTFIQHPANG